MDAELILSIVAIVVLLFISAFFSGSETSLTAASRPRLHRLEQRGQHKAKLVNELLAGKDRLIGAILLGNNLVNIMASAIATSVLIGLFGEPGVVYATVVMTLLVLIFAEVLPKTYAFYRADRLALLVAPMLGPIVKILAPLTHLVQIIVRLLLRVVGIDLHRDLDDDASVEELRGAIDLHVGESEEEHHERAMLRSILDLADVEVEEIMVHRRDAGTLDVELSPKVLVEAVLQSPYTRFPLWRDDSDNIVGVLHAKALLRAVQGQPDDLESVDIAAIANDPWFIPATTDLLSQLQAFRRRHEHFAIVVDEYGEMLGIVTLEDILEEIVGDIADEHDEEIKGVQPQPDGRILVDGRVTIRDLNRRFEWRLPDHEASTVAGLVLHEARRIPEEKQVFAFHGLSFEIVRRLRNQVVSILITPPRKDRPADALPRGGRPEAGADQGADQAPLTKP